MSEALDLLERHDLISQTPEGAAGAEQPHATPGDGDTKRLASRRKSLFMGLAATIAVLGGGAYAYDHFVASRHVTTDNA